MVRGDKWRKRPEVLRYWAFKDECLLKIRPEQRDLNECTVTFCISVPKSWSKAKKVEHYGTPHRSRPDLDNLFKALADALNVDDSHIHTIRARKVWAGTPGIVIDREE